MTYYRYTDIREFDDNAGIFGELRTKVRLDEFQLVKKTPCGAWITSHNYDKLKFVLDFSKKKFAYPNKKDAWNSFQARKKKQVAILTEQLKRATDSLTLDPEKDLAFGGPFIYLTAPRKD